MNFSNPFRKKHVLTIEDDQDIAAAIELYLTKLGDFKVTKAENGNDGVRMAGLEQPDLILLDCMLPDIDGLKVLTELKSDKRTAKIPVIMLTGRKWMMQVEAAVDHGAEDYLTKPVNPQELVRRVNLHL